jgi:predicted dehydrogenase
VALCDLREEKRLSAAAQYPAARIYDRAEALLDDPDVDVVCIASYDDDHHAQIVRALDNGKHVFAEKPLCIRPEETSAIRAALRRRPDLRLSSNTILRLSPRFQSLREDIRAGRMGRLFSIEGEYRYGRLWKLTEGWRGRSPRYSVVLGGGIHIADLLLWLTAQRVREVYAVGNGIASAGSGFHGRDLVVALLSFADGLVGKLSANFG